MRKLLWVCVAFVVVCALCLLIRAVSVSIAQKQPVSVPESHLLQFIAKAQYTCKKHKTILAMYYASARDGSASITPTNSGAPVPRGSVVLTLSDGRTLTLPQAISASGARYANQSESFVFWNKGDTAFITEGTSTTTYADCATK